MLENIKVGLSVMVIGLGTVFAVLLLLMCVLYVFGLVYKMNEKKNANAPQPAQKAQPQEAAPVPVAPVQSENLTDDSELVAVITAAIAASLNTSTYKLKIASIRRTNAGSAWNNKTFTNNL